MPGRIRFTAVFALLPAILPAIAFAQAASQLRLSWDHCAAEGYVADRSFACNTNTGEDILYASAVLGDEIRHANLAAFGALIDFKTIAPILPSWWQVGYSSTCRLQAVGAQSTSLVASALCTPWYLAGGGTMEPLQVSAFEFPEGPNATRLNLVAAVPSGSEITIPNGPQEYLFLRIRITHARSTGTGSCEGCLVPMCIGFGQLRLQYPATSDQAIVGTMASTVTWQGAYVTGYQPNSAIPYYYHGNLDCSTGPVPAQGRTWGMIKSFYR